MAVERIARLVLPQEGASMTTGVAVGSIDLLLGHPGVGVDLATSVLELLADIDAAALRSRAGFAYATRTGVDELLSPLAGNDHWSSTTKRWLIGVHHAISEPSGLEVLASLSNSQVRLATCGESLRDAIRGRKVFHAKVFAVDTIKGDRLRIITGSANLTAAALSARSRNYEAALKVQSTLRPSATSRFIDWWDAAWREALIVNVANLDMYARLRETFIEDNPDILAGWTEATLSDVASARSLWIEGGFMSGGARNQVEFNVELASFFGPVKRRRRLLTMVRQGKRWTDRPLSPKRTTFDVDIWRLSLPTEAQGGFEYPGRTIYLEKIETSEGTEYRLDVADSDSAKARSWRQASHRQGVVSRTGGGRSYGYV